jgi:osmoprotectant transport system substrate-binding protein
MRMRFRSPVLGAALLALSLVAAGCGGSGEDGNGGGPRITVGAVGFAENQIIAEMYAQVLEGAGYEVERQLNLDSREILQPAMRSGDIDLAPEYLATLAVFLGGEASSDPDELTDQLQPMLREHGLTVLPYAEAVDTNAFVVTRETADREELSKVSDLAPISGELTLGGPPECPERDFCIPGLRSVYGIEFAEFVPLDVGGPLTVEALRGGEIDVGLLFSTDAAIAAHDFVLLEDDAGLQQADNIAPVIRLDVVNDEIRALLDEVSASLTTANVTQLNGRVTIDGEDPADVARAFLEEQGLL